MNLMLPSPQVSCNQRHGQAPAGGKQYWPPGLAKSEPPKALKALPLLPDALTESFLHIASGCKGPNTHFFKPLFAQYKPSGCPAEADTLGEGR